MPPLAGPPRRPRRTESIRRMVRETTLRPEQLVLPLFVRPGRDEVRPIASMPGVEQRSVDRAVQLARQAWEAGVRSVILFGIPDHKDAEGSGAWDPDGPVARAVAEIKAALPEMVVATDVCLCEYTDHGHCGLLRPRSDGALDVANDPTLELLAREALCHARAGADVVAPSDMMDGRVGAIREALDAEGFGEVAVLSYAVKYASAFYGPFREAAESAPRTGPSHRRSYQMDPANAREALREAALDEAEGADLLMVKPALPYLDVLRSLRERTALPLAAYQVSGEYAMLQAAAAAGMLELRAAALEALLSIRRAGADLILTYFAVEAARWLAEG